MSENVLAGISLIVVAGVMAQWLAWRLHVPSILLLLLTGFLVGPVTGLLSPDDMLGDLLFPVVSVSVALILFEGGLSLKRSEFKEVGSVVRNLVTVGILVTWVVIGFAAWFILGWPVHMSILFGAVLTVTGPTVVLPILRYLRPKGEVGNILKWEGMLNDPVGAMLAVLVFEGILAAGIREATTLAAIGLVKTVVLGTALGVVAAWLLTMMLKRNWIPEFLQNPMTLMFVVAAFVASNKMQHESGLFTVTIMGIMLTNQRSVNVKHIIEFKENLRVLLISSLFIILAARVDLGAAGSIGWNGLLFLGAVMFVARPLSVLASTVRSGLEWQTKLFLSWLAPRGIVAAAVSAIFALRLTQEGFQNADQLVTMTFLVIIGTITLQGLTAAPLARKLGISQSNPQGLLIIGAHKWARAIARALKDLGLPVLLVDSNWHNLTVARLQGLPSHYGNILSEHIVDDLDLEGIGRLVALTSNEEVNSLAALHFAEVLGKQMVFQLPHEDDAETAGISISPELRGQMCFGDGATFSTISDRFAAGAVVKATPISEEFDYSAWRENYGESALLLFIVHANGTLTILRAGEMTEPVPGDTIIGLVDPLDGDESGAVESSASRETQSAAE